MAFTIYKGLKSSDVPDRLRYNGLEILANHPKYTYTRSHQGCYIPEIGEVVMACANSTEIGVACGIAISDGLGANTWNYIEETTNKFNINSFICRTGIPNRYVIGYTNSAKDGFLQVTNDSFTTLDPTLYFSNTGYSISMIVYLDYDEVHDQIRMVQYLYTNSGSYHIFYLNPATLAIEEHNTLNATSGIFHYPHTVSMDGDKIVVSLFGSTTLYYSNDRGVSWNNPSVLTSKSSYCIQIIGDTILLRGADTTAGYTYRLFRSDDGGDTFSVVPSVDYSQTGYYIENIQKQNGEFKMFTQQDFGEGNRYRLLRSVDDGLTWENDPLMPFTTTDSHRLRYILEISGGRSLYTGDSVFYINKNFGY